MEKCRICAILSQNISPRIIYKDEFVALIEPDEMDIKAPGQLWLVPIVHYDDFYDVYPSMFSKLMERAQQFSNELTEKGFITGLNLIIQSGEASLKPQNHFLIELFPRRLNDELGAWPLPFSNPDIIGKHKTMIMQMKQFLGLSSPIPFSSLDINSSVKQSNLESRNLPISQSTPSDSLKCEVNIIESGNKKFNLILSVEDLDLIDLLEEISDKVNIEIGKFSKIKINNYELGPEEFFISMEEIINSFGNLINIYLQENSSVDIELD